MDITVFGANGRVGKLVVQRALDRGHRVRAFVHTHDPFDQNAKLRVSAGDVADAEAVQDAVRGAEAVISTLGAFRRGTGPVLAPGLHAITHAMRQHDARRLVMLTGAGVTRPGQRSGARAHLNRFVLARMDRTAVVDAEKALEIVAATDLMWTMLCAPTISADGPDGYVLIEQMPSLLAKVPGPAVAAGLVALAERSTEGGSIVGIKAGTGTGTG